MNALTLSPQTFQELQTFVGLISSTNMIPQSFVDKKTGTINKGDILIAMMMGVEVGLNPIQSLQNVAVIKGRPSIWGDAMLGLCQKHPDFISIDESFNDSTMTATCTVKRRGGKPHSQTFSEEDAKNAKLLPAANDYTPWKRYPKRMISMRARGFALRNQFADALLGLISSEEARDYIDHDEIIIEEEKKTEYYNDTDFNNNFGKWEKVISTGKMTAENLITKIETKAPLTEKQMQILEGIQA